MINYPTTLPRPLLKPYTLNQQSNLLRTQMTAGNARVRKRFSNVPTTFTAEWLCKQSEALMLEGFVEHALNGGVNWFVMDILTPQGLVSHDVRFVSSPLEDCKPYSAVFWQYKAHIEIKKRQTITEEQTVAQLLTPNTIEEFVTGISDAIDTYQD